MSEPLRVNRAPDPTPEQIAARQQAIREEWDEETRAKRKRAAGDEGEPQGPRVFRVSEPEGDE